MKIDLKKFWDEKIVPYLENGKQELVLPAVEVYAEKLVEKNSDQIVEKVAAAIKKMIPGDIDDVLIEKRIVELKAEVKKDLLALAEQISDKV